MLSYVHDRAAVQRQLQQRADFTQFEHGLAATRVNFRGGPFLPDFRREVCKPEDIDLFSLGRVYKQDQKLFAMERAAGHKGESATIKTDPNMRLDPD